MAETFRQNVIEALADEQLRGNLIFATKAMRDRRVQVLPSDPDALLALRRAGAAIKDRVVARLPELLVQLEENCTKNGITVHWAETVQEANRLVLDLMDTCEANDMVKGKSMVSEEMQLNDFLAEHGRESVETDLGEFIIQLCGEGPSHIVAPAMHKNRFQVGEIFAEKIGMAYTDDPGELLQGARNYLRERFRRAGMGLTGVNFAVAETGTICLVENEGNGRMCSTVPPVHVAVMGIEKVLETMDQLPVMLKLLAGSASGQRISTYFQLINGPRKGEEKDGPKEVHLILLDNGRSTMLADPELRRTLKCIRCGCCLNHCPVYGRIGGHAYGAVYSGPVGSIVMPQLGGLEREGELPTASTLCNGCAEVCPVMIPLPSILRRLRNESYDPGGVVPGHGCRRNLVETLVWKGWKHMNTVPALNRISLRLLGLFGRFLPKSGPLGAWTSVRTAPEFARKGLKDLLKEDGHA